MNPRRGILSGGNWIIDHVKVIDAWPAQDTLVSIVQESVSNGGSPYNLLKGLARLGATFPLAGVGLVGEDADGARILEDCRVHGIDTSRFATTAAAATSYTDVMTVQGTGRRTFFHQRGANSLLDVGHFEFGGSAARHFHLGYLLLLDRLDALEAGRPRAAEVLARAQAAGMSTSIDCVSEDSQRFQDVVVPVLPHVDVMFANDFEAERISGVALRWGDRLDLRALREAARACLRHGVRDWVVIHQPEGVLACRTDGTETWQPSVRLPSSAIAGTAGAGDAIAVGVLLGYHEGWPMEESLRLGVCAAASCLSHPTCSEGIGTIADCLALGERCGYREE